MSEIDPINDNDKSLMDSSKKLCRSSHDKMFFGLCGGIAKYNLFDPAIIRFILLFSLFITPLGLIGYVIASIFLPKDRNESESVLLNKRNQRFLIGSILIFASIYYFLKSIGFMRDFRFLFISNQLLVALLSVGAGIWNLLFAPRKSFEFKNKFMRSAKGKRFLGVLSGFANYLSIDLKLLRIIFVLISIFTFGLSILIYFFIAMNTTLEVEDYV